MIGCTCPPTRRRWIPDGTCANCRNRVSEAQIQDEIRTALGLEPGLVLWRNNVGSTLVEYGKRGLLAALLRWIKGSRTEPPPPPPVLRPLVYGLCPGSADLIGCYRGRFLAIETKTVRGRQEPEQAKFQIAVEANGGIYLMPRSVEEAVSAVARLREGLT
jgi:hypothetical protein